MPEQLHAQVYFHIRIAISESRDGDDLVLRAVIFGRPDVVARDPDRLRAHDLLMAAVLRDAAARLEQEYGAAAARGVDMAQWRQPRRQPTEAWLAETVDLPILEVSWVLPVDLHLDPSWDPGQGDTRKHLAGASSVFPAGLAATGPNAVDLLCPGIYRGIADAYESGSFPPNVSEYVRTPAPILGVPHPWERRGYSHP